MSDEPHREPSMREHISRTALISTLLMWLLVLCFVALGIYDTVVGH